MNTKGVEDGTEDDVELELSQAVRLHPGHCRQRCIHDGRDTKHEARAICDEMIANLRHNVAAERERRESSEPAPTLKDEVHAMLDGLHKPGQLSEATIRILWPLLEDALKWRKR